MLEITLALTLVLTGGVIFFAGIFWPVERVRFTGYWTSIIGCAAGLAQSLLMLYTGGWEAEAAWRWLPGLTLHFGLDRLSLFFLAPVFLTGGLSLIYSTGYFHGEHPRREAVNLGFVSFTIAAMAGTLMARDMAGLAVMWEALALVSLAAALHDYERPETQNAGYQYMIFSQAGALFLFAAVGVWAASTGGFGWDPPGMDESAMTAVFFLGLVAFGSKAGLAPLHVWLPHAHPAAPSHVSALMSGALIKMGVYGALRFYLLMGTPPWAGLALMALGAATALMGVLYALGQDDMKKALAYSSVENMGIIFLGIGLGVAAAESGSPRMAAMAFTGALLLVWGHALYKTLLFMAAGAVYMRTGTRRIDRMGGLLKTMPVTGTLFFIGAFAIIGLPPLNGFAGEFFIYVAGLQGTREGGLWFLPYTLAVVALAVTGGLAMACLTRLGGIAFLGEPRAGLTPEECPASMRLAMLIPAALCAALGVAPSIALPAASPVAEALARMVDVEGDASLAWGMDLAWSVSMGAVALLSVFALAYAARRLAAGKEEAAPTWGCGFTRPTPRMQYTGTSFAAPILEFWSAMAPAHEEGGVVRGLFPVGLRHRRRISDLAERALGQFLARPVERGLENLRWIQHGRIHLYVAYIMAAVVALLLAM